MPEPALLLEVLQRPPRLAELPLPDVETVLRQARRSGLLSWIACRLTPEDEAPLTPVARDQLLAARLLADERRRLVAWEVNRVRRAIAGREIPVILLKGAAYILADLPVAMGRLPADLDLLVQSDRLPEMEAALKEHGWEETLPHPHDQRYYREWMHELPPLRHRLRLSEVDVHHSLLPRSGRLPFDPAPLWEQAVPLPELPGVAVLCPWDMTLHAVLHLFFDSDMSLGLRELVVLDGLLRHFGPQPGFWEGLLPRAQRLGIIAPLSHALALCVRQLGTPLPPALGTEGTPAFAPLTTLLRWLMGQALTPPWAEKQPLTPQLARWLLYARGHWVRMPPRLLARHLAIKSRRRWLTHGQIH